VLFNLLDNAAKASPSGAPVTLTVDVGEREIRVEVVDRGRGLDPEAIERLFVHARPRAGMVAPEGQGGLGLVIARRVVAAMGGSIRAESPAVDGVGTRVILTLPVEAAPAPAEREDDGTT
jgi:two-component system sensor histidine kinase KdpD